MDGWNGHWHGFGPWVGAGTALREEGLRRPGPTPDHPQTQAFLTNTMPPLMTGLALTRRKQVAAERTWADVDDALAWLKHIREANPADESGGGLTVPQQLAYSGQHLRLGSDVTWAYYTPGMSFVSFEVICCPNRFHPTIPCPMPPRQKQGRREHVAAAAAPR